MAPAENEDKRSTSSSDSNELKQVKQQSEKRTVTMAETKCSTDSVAVDMCAENKTCSSKKADTTSSRTSLHSCSCGPDCGPEKCGDGRKQTLVGWDQMRSRIFICLIVAFLVWAVIYIPISLTLF